MSDAGDTDGRSSGASSSAASSLEGSSSAGLWSEVVAFGNRYRVNLSSGVDACFPVRFAHEDVRAFSLPNATRAPVTLGSFVGSVERGGSVNCEELRLFPHGNGTHTEGVGHVLSLKPPVLDVMPTGLVPAVVVVIMPSPLGESGEAYGGTHEGADLVVTRASLTAALADLALDDKALQGAALVVRAGLAGGDYSSTNPPYFTTDAIDLVNERGASHLLTDLPSIDRENDGGALSSHRRLWGLAPGATSLPDNDPVSRRRTVTELCRLAGVAAGRYLLSLQVAPLESDAAPSRPLLFVLEPCGGEEL